MRTPGIHGIASVECPRCGRPFTDYDAPVPWLGSFHLTARCHTCHLEHLFEVEVGSRESSVVAVSRTAIA